MTIRNFKSLLFIVLFASCSKENNLKRHPSSFFSKTCTSLTKYLLSGEEMHEIPQGIVRNQCNLGSCWAHTSIGLIENEYQRVYKENIHLSVSFSIYHRINTEIENFLELIPKGQIQLGDKKDFISTFSEGSNFDFTVKMIKRYGLIPDYAWKDKSLEGKKSNKLFKIKAHLYDKLKEFEEENQMIQKQFDLYKITENEKNHHRARLYFSTHREIKDFLSLQLKVPPHFFEFKGEKLTPYQFAKKYFSFILNDEYINVVFSKNADEREEELKNISSYLISNFKNEKRAVYAGFDWHNEMVDDKKGIIALKERTKKAKQTFSHAVQIVGVILNDQGHPKSWKILNSWGEEYGIGGHYLMDHAYLKEYIQGIYYFRDSDPIKLDSFLD